MVWGQAMSQVDFPQADSPQIGATGIRPFRWLPRLEIVFIGLLSVLVLQLFRTSTSRWLTALWIETSFFLLLPALVLWGVAKKTSQMRMEKVRFSGWLQLGALAFGGLHLLVQFSTRQYGIGDPAELVWMMTLQWTAWYLIVFSALVPSFRKVGFVTCCALVLFVCFMSARFEVFVTSFFFATSALWHLLSNYWSSLDEKALEGSSRMLPVNSVAMVVSLAAIVGSMTILYPIVPHSMTVNLSGFSPFSGGDQGYQDAFARSGIGDGNLLAAGNNARSAGPVQSDQFIEDDAPSLYDVIVEKYSAATEFKRQKTRAAALDIRAKHLKEIVESEQAGKSFSTSRKPPTDRTIDLEDRRSKALFYVEGATPVRFSVECFQHFDGWNWSKIDLSEADAPKSKITLIQEFGSPWYQKSVRKRNFLSINRAHRVKILRLKTNVLPAPSLLRAWHIDRVNIPNLFAFNRQGVVEMKSDFIPKHTVIDCVSDVPNLYLLSKWIYLDLANADSPFQQVPLNKTKDRIEQLAQAWTAGHPRGWQQVESIIGRLRNEFVFHQDLVATEAYADSVEAFLEQKGGPAYQFASVATLLLRAAGYKTRLKSGFLVSDEDFDWKTGQSIVTSDNLHMWPEICLDGWHWIPVEPTPGVDKPYHHLTLSQWCLTQAAYLFVFIKQHPIVSLLGVVILGLLFRYRWEFVARAAWMTWRVAFALFPKRRLLATRKLIDMRFWAAGFPRPRFEAVSNWFSRPDPNTAKQFCRLWQIENYSRALKPSLQKESVALACRQIVSDLTFKRIKSSETNKRHE